MGRPRIYTIEEAKERRKMQQRGYWKNWYYSLTPEERQKKEKRRKRAKKPDYWKNRSATSVKELSARYIKYVIAKDTGLKFKNIPMELVELKRIQIQNQRLIKTMS